MVKQIFKFYNMLNLKTYKQANWNNLELQNYIKVLKMDIKKLYVKIYVKKEQCEDMLTLVNTFNSVVAEPLTQFVPCLSPRISFSISVFGLPTENS